MKSAPIPPSSATALLRSLGMVLQQATLYGMGHNVTSLARCETFALLESALALYGAIEIIDVNNALLLNGLPVESRDPAIHHLRQRLEGFKLGGLRFAPEPDEEEFATLVRLLSSSASTLAQLGGLKTALDNAKLRSIATTKAAYRKVPATTIEAPIPPPETATSTKRERHPSSTAGVIDLSMDLADIEDTPVFQAPGQNSSPGKNMDERRRKRRENAIKMASMLRATAALLENEGSLPGELGQQQILASIERILKMLETASNETRLQIVRLAGQVAADRQTIASIESAARRKGIGFNLTRKELLEQYSEINQEMLQPITVSSGALDLLLSGKGGELEPSQRELIKLAHEGMQRVNQLIEFTKRISGLPETYTPDTDLIRDSYS